MKPVSYAVSLLLVLSSSALAQMLPDAPSSAKLDATLFPLVAVHNPDRRPVDTPEQIRLTDRKFLTLAALSTAATFADSFTTTWARQNWLAGKQGVCNMESESAFLYGLHPTPSRAYTVAAFKSAGTIALSHYLRKHKRKWWSAPLLANTALSLQGVGRNLAMCN